MFRLIKEYYTIDEKYIFLQDAMQNVDIVKNNGHANKKISYLLNY